MTSYCKRMLNINRILLYRFQQRQDNLFFGILSVLENNSTGTEKERVAHMEGRWFGWLVAGNEWTDAIFFDFFMSVMGTAEIKAQPTIPKNWKYARCKKKEPF